MIHDGGVLVPYVCLVRVLLCFVGVTYVNLAVEQHQSVSSFMWDRNPHAQVAVVKSRTWNNQSWPFCRGNRDPGPTPYPHSLAPYVRAGFVGYMHAWMVTVLCDVGWHELFSFVPMAVACFVVLCICQCHTWFL